MNKGILILFSFFCLFFVACTGEDFTTSPDYTISFSKDTVSFDTIFTGMPSSVRRVMIYNNNNKSLSLNSVILKSGGNSGFYINLDGQKGTSFNNVDIMRNDSMHLFVGVNIKETEDFDPIYYNDEIEFSYNGNNQKITLEAHSWNAVKWNGKILDADTTLTSKRPVIIYDSLIIAPGVTVNLSAGTRLYMHDKANIVVKGTLKCNGELNNQVQIRGDRTDNMFDNLPYNEMSAQWGDLIFTEESYDNHFIYSQIRGMTNGIILDSCDVSRRKLMIENSNIRNSNNALLSAHSSWVEAVNTIFANSGGPLVSQTGGKGRFTHCTIANFYKLGIISSAAVRISNYDYDDSFNKVEYPLLQADFNNTIIWGNRSSEVSLASIDDSGEYNPYNYCFRFDHCVIKARGTDDNEFINTLWNENPLFNETGDDYKYDFGLQSGSPVIGKGSPEYAIQLPNDLNGIVRLPGNADIGALQFIAK